MDFKTYTSQQEPVKRPWVVLTRKDVDSWIETSDRLNSKKISVYVSVMVLGRWIQYETKPGGDQFYTLDQDGNTRNPSVFHTKKRQS